MVKRFRVRCDRLTFFAVLVSIGLIFFNTVLRDRLSQSMFLALNLPVYIAFIFFSPNQKQKILGFTISKKELYKKLVFFGLLLVLIWSMLSIEAVRIRFIFSIAFPVLLAFVRVVPVNNIVYIFKIWIKVLNTVLLIVMICGIIDLVTGYSVTKFFTDFYHTEAILQMRIDEPNRIISLLGHPLFASEIGLIGCICNCIDSFYFKQSKRSLSPLVVSFVVIALSGSKIAFLLSLILMLVLNFNNRRIRNVFIACIAVYAVYYFGFLNIVIDRFQEAFDTGDLSTGRNIRLLELYSSGLLDFNWFIGHGKELSEYYVIALEYPILRLSYRYGILYALCLYAVIFVFPIVRILKRKQWFLLLLLLSLIIDVNTYSGIASIGDGMLMYCFMLFILLNISELLLKEETVKLDERVKLDESELRMISALGGHT